MSEISGSSDDDDHTPIYIEAVENLQLSLYSQPIETDERINRRRGRDKGTLQTDGLDSNNGSCSSDENFLSEDELDSSSESSTKQILNDTEQMRRYTELAGSKYTYVPADDDGEGRSANSSLEDPDRRYLTRAEPDGQIRRYSVIPNPNYIDPEVFKMFDHCNWNLSAQVYLSRKLYLVKPYYYQYRRHGVEGIHKMSHKTDLSKLRIPNNFTLRTVNLRSLINLDPYKFTFYQWSSKIPKTIYDPHIIGVSHLRTPLQYQIALCPYCLPAKLVLVCTGDYKSHLCTSHGVFVNGLKVENPDYDTLEDCFICPYGECLHSVQPKGSGNRERRFSQYLKHVYDAHDKFENLIY